MGTRSGYRMVDEDDPQWCRFWNAYPSRVAKKEARKAWLEIDPSPELVDEMVSALDWQSARWTLQGYGTPYPASWLRAERWTDEMPPPALGNGARGARPMPSYEPWVCPHLESCRHRAMCQLKDAMPHKYPRRPEVQAS